MAYFVLLAMAPAAVAIGALTGKLIGPANARAAIEAMGREGGAAYRPKFSYNAQGVIAPYGQPAAATQAAPAVAPAPPKMGELRDGYRFKGGDPANPASWAKASP